MNISKKLRYQIILVFITACLSLAGCIPNLPNSDSGHSSYVRQIVPILQGRKIRGYNETKLLSDLVQLTDKPTVVRALIADQRFVKHWSEVLVDDLRVHRDGSQSQNNCFGTPLRASISTQPAEWAVLATPQAGAQPIAMGQPQLGVHDPFNMTDLLNSALTRDNLYPVYSAYLFAAQSRPGFMGGDDEFDRRNRLGDAFQHNYLNRNIACLLCHNSEFSTSGESTGWNRSYTIPGAFEKALFGSSEGEPTDDVFAMFRTDVTSGGTIDPWGMQNCGRFKTSVPNDTLGITAHFINNLGQQATVFDTQAALSLGYFGLLDGLDRSLPPDLQQQCDFCSNNCSGSTASVEQTANNAMNAATVKAIFAGTPMTNGNCQGCHGGSGNLYFTDGNDWANDLINITASGASGETLVIPGDAANSYLIKKLKGTAGISGQQMPPGGNLSNTQISQIEAWINSMPSLSACAVCPTLQCNQIFPSHVDGNEAFAFLTAANIVENVWEEVFGHGLTIANYFPRNQYQRNILWNLTEFNFIRNQWSLEELLVKILTTEFFNREAPKFSNGSTAYDIKPAFDPWTVRDPREPPLTDAGYDPNATPENHNNAVGDAVYRYSARSLLSSIHYALDWPEPQRFPNTGYPSAILQKEIGQFFSSIEPGFQVTDFQSLLSWEATHGACAKPSSGTDWIDRLITAINSHNPASSGGPLSVEDVATVMRAWFLGHGGVGSANPATLSQTEGQAIAALFGVSNTGVNITTVNDLETKLRKACGTMVESPQFMLAGLAPQDLGPIPRLEVCNDGVCSYQQMCQEIKPHIDSQLTGQVLRCEANSVSLQWTFRPAPGGWLPYPDGGLCPISRCGFIPDITIVECRKNNPLDCAPKPPPCDPRCATIDCCGGPLPPIDRRPDGYYLAWADGARVAEAENVLIKPDGSKEFEPLRPEAVLQAGDLLAIEPDATLSISDGEQQFATRPAEKDEWSPETTRYMLVTGQSVLDQKVKADIYRQIPWDKMNVVRQAPWYRHGEGGQPLTIERYQSSLVPVEELGLDNLRERGLLTPELEREIRQQYSGKAGAYPESSILEKSPAGN